MSARDMVPTLLIECQNSDCATERIAHSIHQAGAVVPITVS